MWTHIIDLMKQRNLVEMVDVQVTNQNAVRACIRLVEPYKALPVEIDFEGERDSPNMYLTLQTPIIQQLFNIVCLAGKNGVLQKVAFIYYFF
jgi:hypothetical protein